jgi:hypothetical protein
LGFLGFASVIKSANFVHYFIFIERLKVFLDVLLAIIPTKIFARKRFAKKIQIHRTVTW